MPLTKVGTPSGTNPVARGTGKQAGMIAAARAANVVHAKHPVLAAKKRMGKAAAKRVQSSVCLEDFVKSRVRGLKFNEIS